MLLSAQKWHSPTSSKKDGCKETLLTFQLAIAKGALSLSEGRGLCLCASGIAEKGSWSKLFREQGKIVSRVQDTFVYMHAPWAAQRGPEIRTERVHISQPLCDDDACHTLRSFANALATSARLCIKLVFEADVSVSRCACFSGRNAQGKQYGTERKP